MQNKVLFLTTGEIGMRHQALGLANALANDVYEQKVDLGAFWSRLPANWIPNSVIKLPELIEKTNIVISCGRRSASFSIALKKLNPELFTIHIQNPQIPLHYFDLVVPMDHDGCKKSSNTFPVATALHHLTQKNLHKEINKFDYKYSGKKIVIILGGNTKDFTFTENNLNEILNIYGMLKKDGYGVLLTTARRTPDSILQKLKQIELKENDWFYFGEGDNPYKYFLAVADGFIMTSDSVSMVSETLITGKPVYLTDLEGHNKRIELFKNNLINKGYVKTWQGQFNEYGYEPVDAKIQVAEKVKELLSKRSD